ncbi:unnamed protein product [Moneuplotes crassus]|uniref:Uncharacterized protein n=1 Tax=Euplotes crassus TaxID=5936 RepID=A0AAD1UJ15_EUPCR|nr:unnamed protein product [Moneuplotes crassus]
MNLATKPLPESRLIKYLENLKRKKITPKFKTLRSQIRKNIVKKQHKESKLSCMHLKCNCSFSGSVENICRCAPHIIDSRHQTQQSDAGVAKEPNNRPCNSKISINVRMDKAYMPKKSQVFKFNNMVKLKRPSTNVHRKRSKFTWDPNKTLKNPKITTRDQREAPADRVKRFLKCFNPDLNSNSFENSRNNQTVYAKRPLNNQSVETIPLREIQLEHTLGGLVTKEISLNRNYCHDLSCLITNNSCDLEKKIPFKERKTINLKTLKIPEIMNIQIMAPKNDPRGFRQKSRCDHGFLNVINTKGFAKSIDIKQRYSKREPQGSLLTKKKSNSSFLSISRSGRELRASDKGSSDGELMPVYKINKSKLKFNLLIQDKIRSPNNKNRRNHTGNRNLKRLNTNG